MPRSRRKRTAAAAHAFTASGWDGLPTELAHQIIELACHDTATAVPRRTVPRLDTSTLINISLISRNFYHLTGPLRASLYRQINVTGVNALQGLHQTLTAQSELASLNKSLRVGPMTSLPRAWWPLVRTHSEPRSAAAESRNLTWIKTSLDEKELPAGCCSQRFWSVSHPCPRDSCRDVYIWNTLQRAQQALRISLTTDGRCSLGTHASGWAERVFYCQAILDLCLLKIREMEDADPSLREKAQACAAGPLPISCALSSCGHYPPLVIKNIKKRTGKGPPNAEFALTIPQLLRHLARRGSLTDHFDHPLHFARSGIGRLSGTPCVPLHQIRECGARWCFDRNEANAPLEREEEEQEESQGHPKSGDALGKPTTTLTTILHSTRGILASTPNLKTLSIAGYLEQIFAKQQNLPNLRRLSIGPQPGTGGTLLSFGGLKNVLELRLCCGVPAYREADEISTKMRRLERVKWYMSAQPCVSLTPLIVDALNGLLGRNDPAAAAAAAAVGSPIHSDRPVSHDLNVGTLDRLSLDDKEEGFLVEAFLPPATRLQVLRQAAAAEIEAAWRTGGALPDTRHRLRLSKVGENADDDVGWGDSDDDADAPSWEELCEREIEWWDRFANEPRVSGPSAGLTELGEQVEHAGQSSCGGAQHEVSR